MNALLQGRGSRLQTLSNPAADHCLAARRSPTCPAVTMGCLAPRMRCRRLHRPLVGTAALPAMLRTAPGHDEEQ